MNVGPQILKAGGQEERGEVARLQYYVGAIAVGDLVKSTLGPKGRDKILQPIGGEGSSRGNTTITNDGATILRSVWIDNPAAKILVDLSKRQDTSCGDGTTGVVVLAAELLRHAEQLVESKIHPQVIVAGYRLALAAAREALEGMSHLVDKHNNGITTTGGAGCVQPSAALRGLMLHVAKSTLSSKLVVHERDLFAGLACDAVCKLGPNGNTNLIQVIKRVGGTMGDSFLADGFILQKSIGVGMPKKIENCKVLIANSQMDADKIKIYGARVKVDSFNSIAALAETENQKMKEKVDKIVAHKCNVFVNRQLIYNYPEQLFRDAGVLSIEHADFDGVESLAAVLGGEIASTFEYPDQVRLGECDLIEEIIIGESKMIHFKGCRASGSCSIVLRGANGHVLDEAERSLHDAIAVLSVLMKDPRIVYGAGAAEMHMAAAVDKLVPTVPGKKALAIEAYAKALRSIPTIILDNGGFDAAEIVARLRTEHHKGNSTAGIDIERGDVGDIRDLNVLESYQAKLSQLCSASEAAEMTIRVDDVIRCAPRRREGM